MGDNDTTTKIAATHEANFDDNGSVSVGVPQPRSSNRDIPDTITSHSRSPAPSLECGNNNNNNNDNRDDAEKKKYSSSRSGISVHRR